MSEEKEGSRQAAIIVEETARKDGQDERKSQRAKSGALLQALQGMGAEEERRAEAILPVPLPTTAASHQARTQPHR